MHDIHRRTVLALPGMLDGLMDGGYRTVTTSQLFYLKPIEPLPGQIADAEAPNKSLPLR
jgi:hypothetical protein